MLWKHCYNGTAQHNIHYLPSPSRHPIIPPPPQLPPFSCSRRDAAPSSPPSPTSSTCSSTASSRRWPSWCSTPLAWSWRPTCTCGRVSEGAGQEGSNQGVIRQEEVSLHAALSCPALPCPALHSKAAFPMPSLPCSWLSVPLLAARARQQ